MKSNYLIKLIALSLVMIQLTSCATICNGTRQTVNLGSTPAGADVYVDSHYVGKTPLALKLKRKQAHEVYFVSEGYQSQLVRLESTFDPKMTINVIPGLCVGFYSGALAMFSVGSDGALGAVALAGALVGTGIGCGIDCLTGGGYKLSSDHVNVLMKPEL